MLNVNWWIEMLIGMIIIVSHSQAITSIEGRNDVAAARTPEATGSDTSSAQRTNFTRESSASLERFIV